MVVGAIELHSIRRTRFAAVLAAVHLHGLAGDVNARKVWGNIRMVAHGIASRWTTAGFFGAHKMRERKVSARGEIKCVRAYSRSGQAIRLSGKLRNAVLRRGSSVTVTSFQRRRSGLFFIRSTSTAFQKRPSEVVVRCGHRFGGYCSSAPAGTPHPNVVALHCDSYPVCP